MVTRTCLNITLCTLAALLIIINFSARDFIFIIGRILPKAGCPTWASAYKRGATFSSILIQTRFMGDETTLLRFTSCVSPNEMGRFSCWGGGLSFRKNSDHGL